MIRVEPEPSGAWSANYAPTTLRAIDRLLFRTRLSATKVLQIYSSQGTCS